jgi:alkylation response protein AidB-like acyl-CoA dehydrogenase
MPAMEGEALLQARALLPRIHAAREETETGRCLAPSVVAALRGSRLGRLALPTELGGYALPPVEILGVLELLAGTEASAAWIVWNNTLPCYFGRFLAPDARTEIFGDAQGLYASSTRPSGRATVDGDGYRVKGRWSLVSGCEIADWLALRCAIEENGQPRMLAPNVPEVRMVWIRRRDVQILDTWHTGGLRGTGSHDVVLDDLLVPQRHSCSPADGSRLAGALGRVPIVGTLAAGYGAQLLGLGQACVDAVVALTTTKQVVDPGPAMGERPLVLASIAEQRVRLAAARDYLHARVAELWASAEQGAAPLQHLAAVFAAAHHAMGAGRGAVAAMYALGGASSLYTNSPLERAHRDMHAMAAHVISQPMWLEDTGRVGLGREPVNPMYRV